MEHDSHNAPGLVIGIDATNLRQGGGITHLTEFLNAAEPSQFGISAMIVWGCGETLSAVADNPWLRKISPPAMEKGLFRRLVWQLFSLSDAAKEAGCDLLLVPGGSYFGRFRPVVTMSRNMLPFEPHEARRFGRSLATLRLGMLKLIQSYSFRHADGVIFLTEYARQCVLNATGTLEARTLVIPHGISSRFRIEPRPQRPITEYGADKPFRLLYVSIINHYKHQWHVAEAVAALRSEGHPLTLDLVGPAHPTALARLKKTLARVDPTGNWVRYRGVIPYPELHAVYSQADLGIFASSCENMPNILLETMAAGLPIACSSLGPMPEVLRNAGVYFHPEDPKQIERALRDLIESPELRTSMARSSYGLSQGYSWKRCAQETQAFLSAMARRHGRRRIESDAITVGIDASRNRSGGAKGHLIGILAEGDPLRFGIDEVHVWAYRSLLDSIPDRPWLVKHNPPALERSLLSQLGWQRFRFPREATDAGCSIVLNTDAGTISTFKPSVTMSRDMLSYEPGEIERFGFSKARARLILLRYMQNRSLSRADGAVFLTRHAAKVIQKSCGALKNIAYIPHGVGANFKLARRPPSWPMAGERPVRCIYVSNAAMYKHQWMVVRAIADLRKRGYDLLLTLVGGGKGRALELLQDQLAESDPDSAFVRQIGFVPQDDLPALLVEHDLFVFASSCENMPNTLVEAMATGLPIACSNRGPMPEVLADGGVYFDPEDSGSIAKAIEQLLNDPALRATIAQRAAGLSEHYSWERCANETWGFVADTAKRVRTGARPYRVCSKCVMDTTDSMIQFDEHGVCDHCNTFLTETLPSWHTDDRGKAELDRMVREIRAAGQGKDFDCIIGMSGGIDSSYLTYVAKEKLGLRPLVFHVDAGWNSDIAVNNIEKLVDGLGLDLFTEVIDWEEMKDLQLAFFRSGVPHIDAPQDHAFFATMYKFAVQHKVNYILTGANLSTECIRNPIEWMYYQSDSRQLLDIHRRFGTRPLKRFPVTSILWHKIWLPYFRGVRVLRPLNNLPYVKADARQLLMERFGWQPYPQKHFESRFTRFYESYWLPKRFGYDVRRVQFSSLIVTGQMTRDEALRQLEQPSFDAGAIDQEIEFVANKLGISIDELNGYMRLPKRSYMDFKSQRQIYDIGARTMKALGMEVGGKR